MASPNADADLQILLKLAKFIAGNRNHPMPPDLRKQLSERITAAATTMTASERRLLIAEFEHELAACAIVPTRMPRPMVH